MTIDINGSVFLGSETEESLAALVADIGKDVTSFQTTDGVALPPEVNKAVLAIIQAMREGFPVSVRARGRVVTDRIAASMLGVTDEGVREYIQEGRIEAEKRDGFIWMRTRDVLNLREELKEEGRRAVFELMDLERELERQHQ